MIDGLKRGCKPGRLTGVRLEKTLSRMITLVIGWLGRSMKIERCMLTESRKADQY